MPDSCYIRGPGKGVFLPGHAVALEDVEFECYCLFFIFDLGAFGITVGRISVCVLRRVPRSFAKTATMIQVATFDACRPTMESLKYML
jgi:hypothetical protein